MTRRLLLPLGVLLLVTTGCETAEERAWRERVQDLTAQNVLLQGLSFDGAEGERARATLAALLALRAELDVAAFVREQSVGATVQVGHDGVTTVSRRGSVPECEAVLTKLAPLRWRFESWRLRLGPEGCDWRAQTGAELAAVEASLNAPPRPRWSPPPRSWFSFRVAALEAKARDLEASLAREETRLGPMVTALALQAPVEAAVRVLEVRKRLPVPCDLAILRRELALDAAERGRLLEVEQARLVHPLEPQSDLRLRGLVTRSDGGALAWRCEAP